MVTVIVEDTGNSERDLERALRKFRKEVERDDIINEYKSRQYFEKPSAIEHRKKVSRKHTAFLEKKDAERKGAEKRASDKK